MPFNASGVVQVGPDRFVFVDNNDPSALFELALLPDGTLSERIWRRPLVGVAEGQLLDPEGLGAVDLDGEAFLIAASSLCVRNDNPPGRQRVNDGLVRIRYTPRGDLHAEAMDGFRAWLLTHEPSLAKSGEREPDSGGLNIEGVAWDPRTRALLFGQRGPARSRDVLRSSGFHWWPVESSGRHRLSARPPSSAPGYRNRTLCRESVTSPTTSRPETSSLCSGDGKAAARNRFSYAPGTAPATRSDSLTSHSTGP